MVCRLRKLITAFSITILLFLVSSSPALAGIADERSLINKSDNWYKFQASMEMGFLDVVSHKIQFGSNGSVFDYVKEGSQDVLFPFSRITSEINLSRKHNIIFLIQPFDLGTKALLERDIVIDDQLFPESTPIDLRYGFTLYWRRCKRHRKRL